MTRFSTSALLFLVVFIFGSGCERKEKVLDIDTPRGGIEIERSKDSGNIDVTIERDRNNQD